MTQRSITLLSGLSAGLCFLGLSACWNPLAGTNPSRPPLTEAAALTPALTKDEVLRVNGQPLSLSGYLALRDRYPTHSKEKVLWMATAALALEKQFELPVAIELAHYALEETPETPARELEPPLRALLGGEQMARPTAAQARARLEQLISRSVIERNPQILAEIH